MNEMWKPIRGFEGIYEASDQGRVRLMVSRRGAKAGHIISPLRIKNYVFVRLSIDGKMKAYHLPRLILDTFAPRPNSAHLKVAYDNGRPDDNRLCNIGWITAAEALARRVNDCRGEATSSAKLTNEAVKEIRRRYAEGIPQTKIAPDFGVTQGTVSRVLSGETWGHVA